jgi:hypothetical protein
MEALKSALAHHNYNRELLMTLLSYELESNYLRSALRHAELMVQLEPERADIRQLIDRLWRETR